ncbi:phosphoglycolate phosphatase [uncultured Methanoregula sp.]|uniref:phosphoglycolate phosphatase n=1 Tax=uncultured Methanoregula sp. TaxID=1005933 RepID=UPI002AAB8B37|nr:phosphoglycolate phosphatase [uncultured Methanoregula sp.]
MLKALLTDIDGTITNSTRRIDTEAVELIRSLVDQGIEVVLASGNTPCFMEAISKMVGTQGSFIAENGGVFRAGYTGKPRLQGNQAECHRALETLQEYYRKQGKELELFSPTYRFVDLAFARTVPVEEVRSILGDQPVQVLDTGYAIHLQSPGINKGTALAALAPELGLTPDEFLAVGDSLNDIQMLRTAGIGAAVANAHPDTKAVAQYTAEKEYGKGFVEAVKKYYPYFRAR